MAIDPRLLRFVEDELGRTPALVDRTVAGTLQLLRDPRDNGLTASERGRYFELVEALQRGAASFQNAFAAALRDGVMQELQAQGQDGPGTVSAGGLELMDESRVEVDIEISRAMQIIDSTAEWELRELQTFTSALAGQEHVSAESNPLRPLVYATALWKAACAVASSPAHQVILLRLAAGVMAGLLRSAWAAASSRLEAQGVEPSIYRTVLLAPGSVPGRNATTAALPSGAIGELLQRMPAAPAEPAPLERGVASSSGPTPDSRVVELLGRIFAAIQADTQLSPACRSVIARLQVAALRVAAQDRAMLDSVDHPVWQVMDRIAHASAAYPLADDPRQAALMAFCEAIAEEISRAPNSDTAAFRRAGGRIDAFLAEQRQWQLREADESVKALQRTERREALEMVLSQRLTEQMAHLHTAPEIRRFVTGTWAKVIAESLVRFGEQAEPTPTNLKTVDDLLWSLQTPDHPQSRQRLLALLPGLLQRLRAGMALIGLPSAEQQAVLDQLMVVHTEALRPGTRAGQEALTPQQIVQRMREEVVTGAPAMRPFSDSVIDLASMDTVPADLLMTQTEGSVEDTARRIDTFVPGVRQRMFLRGRWSRVQLLWRSDQGQYFLYAGERAGTTHSVTRRALERLDAAGLVQPLESRPLVQRTLDALQNDLSAVR
jgi:hypothetical protein